jgi:hypothetical protein
MPLDAPAASTGGAALSGEAAVAVVPALPWQEVQVIAFTSSAPSRWVALFTDVLV